MTQEERTKIIKAPLISPKVDSAAIQLSNLLRSGGRLAAGIISQAAADKNRLTRMEDTKIRLAQQKMQVGQSIEREGLRQEIVAEQFKRRTLTNQLQVLDDETERLGVIEKEGAFGLLAELEGDELLTTAERLGVKHPENIRDVDGAIGERRAFEHYGSLLKTIAEAPEMTPLQHLGSWMAANELPNNVQQISYYGALTKLIRQDTEKAVKESISRGNKIGAENSLHWLERDMSLNKQEYLDDPKKMEKRLKDYHSDMLKYAPETSELDIARTFQRDILPSFVNGMTSKQQFAFVDILKNANQKSAYLRNFLSITHEALFLDAEKKLVDEQEIIATELETDIDSIGSNMSNMFLSQSVKDVAEAKSIGLINGEQWNDLIEQLRNKARNVSARTKITGLINSDPRFAAETIQGSDQSLYSTILQEMKVKYLDDNGVEMPLRTYINNQLRAGVLSDDTKEEIRLLIDSPVIKDTEGRVISTGLQQGIGILQQINQKSPSFYHTQYVTKRDGLSTKSQLAVSLIDNGYGLDTIASWIGDLDEEKLTETKEILENIEIDRIVRIAASPRLWIGNVFFTASEKGTSPKAVNLAQDLFKIYYSRSTFGSKESRISDAMRLVSDEIGNRFDRIRIDGRVYLYEPSRTPIDKRTMSEGLDRTLTAAADSILQRKLVRRGGDISFSFDDAQEVDGQFLVPVLILNQPIENEQGFRLSISFPTDFEDIKKIEGKEFDFAENQIIEFFGGKKETDTVRLKRIEREAKETARKAAFRSIPRISPFSGGRD